MKYEDYAKGEATFRNLALTFIRMRGVGGKTAHSIAKHILSQSEGDRKKLALAIITGLETLRCPTCGQPLTVDELKGEGL